MSRPDVPPYFRVSPRFWGDERVKKLIDDLKLLLLYIFTSPHRTIEGIFVLSVHYIVADLGWSARKVTKLLADLEQNGFIAFDPETDVMLIKNALKYQFPENPNQIKGAIRRIKDLPNSVLLKEFQGLVRKHCYRKGTSSDVQGFPYLLDQVLAQRFAQPLSQPPTLSPSPTQAQTTTPTLPRLAGDKEGDLSFFSLSEEEKREAAIRKRWPQYADVETK